MFWFLLQNLPSLEAIFWAEPNSALHGIYVRPKYTIPTNENFHKYLVLDYNLPYILLSSKNLPFGEKIIYTLEFRTSITFLPYLPPIEDYLPSNKTGLDH